MIQRALIASWLACAGCLSAAPAVDGGTKHDLAHGKGDFSALQDLFTPPPRDMTEKCDAHGTTALDPSDGHHNAGQDCGGCHLQDFTLSGTIYTTATGGSALSGATITIDDSLGIEYKIVSTADGNFWSSSAFNYPVKVHSSLCPGIQPMMATVNNGSCNTSGCHDSAMRIHVP